MHRYLAILIVLCSVQFCFGQEKKEEKKESSEKIEALKIAFITNELELTEEESKDFWPVYNNMSQDLQNARKEQREWNKKLRESFEIMSDEDVEKATKAILDNEVKQAEIKRDYTEKIAGIIGYRKATKLLSAEQRFKRELLQRLNRTDKEEEEKINPKESQN